MLLSFSHFSQVVSEIGPPARLLERGGSFHSLVLDTGHESSRRLMSLASTGGNLAREDARHDPISTDFDLLAVRLEK